MHKEARPPKLNVGELKEEKAKEFAVTVTNRFTTLAEIKRKLTLDALWKTMRTILMETASAIVGYKKPEKQKSWITTQTVKLIKEKRTMKYKDQEKYRILKAEVQKKLRQNKQGQLGELCNELEIAHKRGNKRKLFQTAKTNTRKFQLSLKCIKSKTSGNVPKTEKIAERWKEYCQEPYEEKGNTITQTTN